MAEKDNSSPPKPPVTISLTTSSPTCSVSGSPPFTVSIAWTLSGSRPIWALVSLNTNRTYGIEIRDPRRDGRRIGPPPTWIQDEFIPSLEEDLEDVALVKIAPDKPYIISYTFSPKNKADGLRGSDMQHLEPGMSYELTLRETCCRWIYEDEMGDGDEPERKQRLSERAAVLFKPDCRKTFEAV